MITWKMKENEKREAHKPLQEVCYKGARNIQLRIQRRKHKIDLMNSREKINQE